MNKTDSHLEITDVSGSRIQGGVPSGCLSLETDLKHISDRFSAKAGFHSIRTDSFSAPVE